MITTLYAQAVTALFWTSAGNALGGACENAGRKQLLLMAEWTRVQDARIAAVLSAAGWKGY